MVVAGKNCYYHNFSHYSSAPQGTRQTNQSNSGVIFNPIPSINTTACHVSATQGIPMNQVTINPNNPGYKYPAMTLGVAIGGTLASGAYASLVPAAAPIVNKLIEGPANTNVYLGVKEGAANYVGITNNVAARAAQHGARFDTLRTITDNPVTRNQGRAIEQVLIEQNPQFANKINSISPNNPLYKDAISWGTEWLKRNGFMD